ncbi:MAG: hypothetical protein A3F74_04635 [Betaproteobacteria bacterium RIFCSPLOWO2_12_FULL_62_58]|nr:MAG: hypothetical protein A3I62_01130 [Betaproteobacteria bacterium RIFCSPLOWO2_02_FULL_62_79]OGA47769.1 MAG: hypothetical protein A3F74_04635 [Betaproteobacteria bacterium RIFCSPLOWO2_12_FULL_62_58]
MLLTPIAAMLGRRVERSLHNARGRPDETGLHQIHQLLDVRVEVFLTRNGTPSSRLSLVSPNATRTGYSREAQRKRVYSILSRTNLVPDIA